MRDTATFIDVALDNPERVAMIRGLIVKLLSFQHATGDLGVEGISVSNGSLTAPMDKSDAATDQEASVVQIVARYIRHTGDKTVLTASSTSVNDPVPRPVSERLEMMLGFLANETGRTHAATGLIWGSTRVDWGDVQECQGQAKDRNCHQQMNQDASWSIGIYENAMYVIALKDYSSLVNDTAPASAAKWLAKAAEVSSNAMIHLWDTAHHKFRPHIYPSGSVCGPCNGSFNYECFTSKGSPFTAAKHVHDKGWPVDFDEDSIYYHGGTAVAIEAGMLSQEQIVQALADMRKNVRKVWEISAQTWNITAGQPRPPSNLTIGLTIYPPYPEGAFPAEQAYVYQNGGDWSWFGGRIVQQLIKAGLTEDAIAELTPIVDRVCRAGDFREWYDLHDQATTGSYEFHGGAGVIGVAIKMLQALGH